MFTIKLLHYQTREGINIKLYILCITLVLGLLIFLLFPTWSIEVSKEFIEAENFVILFTSFCGIMGAYFVANNQLNKTLKYGNPIYLQRFLAAQVEINYFIKEVEKIEEIVCTDKRTNARDKITYYNFIQLREYIDAAILALNPNLPIKDIKEIMKLHKSIFIINQDAPAFYYIRMNGIVFNMIHIHDVLLHDVKTLGLFGERQHLLLPWYKNPRIQILHSLLKRFKRDYKKLKKELNLKDL